VPASPPTIMSYTGFVMSLHSIADLQARASSGVRPYYTDTRRILWGFGAISFLPLLVLLDASVSWTRGWRWYTRMDLFLVATAVAIFAIVTCGLLVPPVRRFYGRFSTQLVLAVVSTILALSAVEFTLRAIGPWRTADVMNFHRRPPNYHEVFSAEAGVLPGVWGPTHYSTNAQGVRGPEMPARGKALRILCIGGSTTECTYVDDKDFWPALLNKSLSSTAPVWVGAVAKGGAATPDHLRFVRGSTLMDEIDCAVLMVGANDASRAVFTPVRPYWSGLELVNLLRDTAQSHIALEIEDTKALSYILRRQERAAARKTDIVPDVSTALEKYKRNIRELARLCHEHGVRPLFLTQPTGANEGMPPEEEALLWQGRVSADEFLTPRAYVELLNSFNRALMDVCGEVGAEYLDVAANMDGDMKYYYDDAHFNVVGCKRLAELIATYVESNPLTYRATSTAHGPR
jgi:lysophospholipase L1-like esterase